MSSILFVTPTSSLQAGGEVSNLELIKYGVEQGHTIYAVTPESGVLNKEFKKIGVKSFPTSYGWWGPSITPDQISHTGFTATEHIVSIAKKYKVECIVTNTLNLPWGGIAAARLNLPHVWIAREFPYQEFEYLTDRYPFINSFSNLVMGNSENLAQYMKNSQGIKKASHFYSFVDTSALSLKTITPTTKARIVNVGNIEPRKNQLALLEAVGAIKDPVLRATQIILIGNISDKRYYSKILKAAKTLNINLEILSFQNEPWKHVTALDIFVQPSLSESIGRSITEAMKLGVFSVGADIPGTKEAISLGGGKLYKSGDVYHLSRILEDLLRNPAHYQKEAKTNQKLALKNMSRKNCNEPFYTALKQTIGQPNPQNNSGYLFELIEAYVQWSKDKQDSLQSTIDTLNTELQAARTELETIKGSRGYKAISAVNKARHRLNNNSGK